MIGFVFAVFGVAFFLVGVVRASQHVRARRQVREAAAGRMGQESAAAAAIQRARVRRSPLDYLYLAGVLLKAALVRPKGDLTDLRRRSVATEKRLATLPGPAWTGLQLFVRLACACLLPMVLVASAVLNVLVFVALNDGVVATAAVLKGVGAATIELLLAFTVARLVHEPRTESLRWLGELAFAAALLVSVVGFVAMYSPQRSEQAYGYRIDLDQRQLTYAQQSGQPLAITAAQDQLDQDQARLRRAEQSDTALAVAVPLVEAAAAGMAIEGAVAAIAAARRRRAGRMVEGLLRAINAKEVEVEAIGQEHLARAMTDLWGEGVVNLEAYGNPPRRPPDVGLGSMGVGEPGPGPTVPPTGSGGGRWATNAAPVPSGDPTPGVSIELSTFAPGSTGSSRSAGGWDRA